jgi:TonB family protein
MNHETHLAPKVFISYSWDSEEYKNWVRMLCDQLLDHGINVLVDFYELMPGDDLPDFMARCIRTSDKIVILCSPSYKEKAESRSGGVGFESSIITAKIVDGEVRRRFIPVVTVGDRKSSIPDFLSTSLSIDLLKNSDFEIGFKRLVLAVMDKPELEKPPLGRKRMVESKFELQKELASYPGGEEAMLRDLYTSIVYPEPERLKGIQGTVLVRFTVEKDGSLSNIEAIKEVANGAGLSRVAVKAVASLKRFDPARMNGNAVRITMNIPIRFTLK